VPQLPPQHVGLSAVRAVEQRDGAASRVLLSGAGRDGGVQPSCLCELLSGAASPHHRPSVHAQHSGTMCAAWPRLWRPCHVLLGRRHRTRTVRLNAATPPLATSSPSPRPLRVFRLPVPGPTHACTLRRPAPQLEGSKPPLSAGMTPLRCPVELSMDLPPRLRTPSATCI
jgi:hypothetical protein